MTLRRTSLCWMWVLALSLMGCAKAVQILGPDPGSAPWNPDDRNNYAYQNYPDGVHVFVVQFHQKFNPESFRAELDGTDITQMFQPGPAPGGTSKAPAPQIFWAGTPYFLPGVYIGTPQAPSPTQTQEVFGIFHKLVVHGQLKTSGQFFWDHDQVNFYPPRPFFKPDYLKLQQQGSSQIIEVGLPLPPTAGPLPVTITAMTVSVSTGSATPGNKAVSLNGQAPGTPITVTFGVGERVKTFSIVGVPPGGGFTLFATAEGCQVGGVGGYVY